ncbi:MAG: hypothetical protein K0R53_2830, partial [Burkholderiales bacterium]|nr:hypothetical protein [Burkholderiales bacterium]
APPADVVAAWVERIAGQMQKEAAAPESWAKLYDEVAAAFAGNPSALFGKKFLLSVNSDLISSELPAGTGSSGRSRRAADVYFAPVMSVDADVDDDESKQSLPLERLPATLRKGFALLNRDVPWLKDDGGHRPGRSFLISAKLAREYDTRDVLRTLAGVTRTSESEHTRAQALEWAFRLWNSGRSLSDKETRAAGFFVPTAEGWIPAEAAMFGGGWDTPNGKKLHALLRAAADSSPDLMQCQRRLLPEYQSWPIRHGPQADWLRFLAAAGVADCLRPVGGESVAFEKIGYPANLPEAISRAVAGMPEAVRAHWSTQLAQDCLHMFSSRQYRAEVRPWRIPGQDDHDKLAPEIRREYAVQIVLAMRVLSDEHRTFRAVRANTGAAATEPHRMSTPLSAFLTGAEWLPVTRPGGRPRFVKPGAAWYFQAEDERPPRFIDFIAHPVTSAIDAAVLEWLRDRAQLGVFNDQKHAGRALLALSEATSTRITDIRDVRRFQDLFRRLWANVRHAGSPQPATRVPVHLRGEISGVSKTDGDIAKAYFDDGRDGLKKQLLEEVGEPVFDFVEGDATAVWNWINASTPGRFHRISDEPAEIFVDGSKYDDGTVGQPLSEIVGGWIIDFVVCVAEHKGSAFVQSTQNTLGKIRRAAMALTLVSGQEIQIAHGDERLPLPASLRGALALQRPHGPVLIVQSEGVVTLAQLAEGAGQLAVALGSRELANGFEAALLRLSAAQRDDTGAPPDDATIAAALGVDLDALKETRRLASGDLGSMLDLAIPLSACKGSPDITARLLDLAAQEDPDEGDLRAGLEALATVLGSSLPELEERMRHLVDLSDLKAEFALPIAQLNEAVATLGGRYKPVSNEGSHRDAWTRHLRQRLPMTVERLRERAVARFDRGEPLTPYASARDGALLVQPDSTWFTTYDELPEAVMDARIDRWVDDCLPANQAEVPLDATLGEVRASNGARLREFWTKFSPLLSAWIRTPTAAASAGVRQAWMNPETTRDTFAARARDSGWFDFRVLDDDRIAAWLTLEGAWPGGRPASVDLDVWGISAEAIVTSEERAKAERAEQQRRRTQVEFAGTKMS